MKIIAPAYYNDFKCINKNCRHSCCIGWEIDIDANTYEKYKSIDNDFGKKLNKNILFDGETSSFKLCENERCPFLNKDNLCDIILNLGEDALCQICSDHPRFRNYFADRIEVGLGLCCEEASRLIISEINPFGLIEIDNNCDEEFIDDTELDFFEIRNDIFKILQDESDLKSKISCIFNMFDIKFPEKTLNEWADIYLRLEMLDNNWSSILNLLKISENINIQISTQYDKWFENLFTYFIYRHLCESVYDGKFKERLIFSVLSCYMIYSICYCKNEFSIKHIIEVARMYSSEIEYSDENINSLLELL